MTDALKAELRLILYAVQFLTRIPVPAWVGHESGMLERSSRWFPLVGGLVGAGAGSVWLLALQVLPPLPAAGLAVVAMVLLTGAFHEDGLADTADGLGGGLTRERALEIMRDSRIGTYGAAALIMALILRVVTLASLAPLTGVLALIAAHAGARLLVVAAMRLAPYARDEGLGKPIGEGVAPSDFGIALVGGVLLSLPLGLAGPLSLALAAIPAGGLLVYLKHRLGGYTGDGLGAIAMLGELAMLSVLLAWLG